MTLGKRIASLRKELNMTQQDMANALAISRGAVSMWELGQRNPSPIDLQRLADFFSVTVDYLLGRTANRQFLPRPDASTTDFWNQTAEPTPQQLEEILRHGNVYFDGAPLDDADREDVIEFLRLAWRTLKKRNS